jgi:ABC-2 type transport system permease protein
VAVAVVYIGFWQALATLTSVAVSRAATSALISLGVWLVLALFGTFIFQAVANLITAGETEETVIKTELAISHISPLTLFSESSTVLLDPQQRATGLVSLDQVDRAIPSNLTLSQSLLVVWPQIVGLIALTAACFAAAYVSFMRQEVRA